jgi:hypothetical protein
MRSSRDAVFILSAPVTIEIRKGFYSKKIGPRLAAWPFVILAY